MMREVREGADRIQDDPSPPTASPTILAEYTTAVFAGLLQQSLFRVHSCLDRTSGTTDISDASCADLAGSLEDRSETYAYTWSPNLGGMTTNHLLVRVERMRVASTGALFRSTEESFSWDLKNGDDPFVSAHASAGLELSAPIGADQPDGTMIWTENCTTPGLCPQKRITYEKGVPKKFERFLTQWATLKQRVFSYSVEHEKRVLGLGRSSTADNNAVTLRHFDEDGRVTFEVEVVPNGSLEPQLSVAPPSGGCDPVSVTNTSLVRRATKHFYTTDSVRRLFASATLTSPSIHQPAGIVATGFHFPSTAPPSWSHVSSPATGRDTPTNKFLCAGSDRFYDVDVFDADSGVDAVPEDASNGRLNEPGERQIVWTHHAKTTPGGGIVSRSSRMFFDNAGRVIERREHDSRSILADADVNTVARERNTFFAVDASTKARNRGRLLTVTTFAKAGPATNPIVSFSACGASDTPYDELGNARCWDVPQTPTALRTTIDVTSNASDDSRRALTTLRLAPAGTVFLSRFSDQLMSGAVFDAGVIGGNHTKTFWTDILGQADFDGDPTKVQELDSGVGVLRSTTFDYDSFGRVIKRKEWLGDVTTLRRYTEFTYADEEQRVAVLERHLDAGEANVVATTTTFDPETGDVVQVTEGDGDVVVNTYGASGNARGKLVSVKRGTIDPVQALSYDSDGRIATVTNGNELAATYTYAEGGRLDVETLNGVGVTGGSLNRKYLDELAVLAGVANRVDRVVTRNGVFATLRDVETVFDNLGRPILLCDNVGDPSCASPIVEWFYETRVCSSYATSYTVEGTASGETGTRTFTLTANNLAGRVSHVRHPAGVTFHEYDALGRVKALVQYETTTLPACGAALDGTKMKVTEYSFGTAGQLTNIRYPSGRAVQQRFNTADKRRPDEVLITGNRDGATSLLRIASDTKYDVDDFPMSWRWGTQVSPDRRHFIDRDFLGRVTNIHDALDAVKKTELRYTYLAADFDDVDTNVDPALQPPVLSLGTSSTTRDYDYVAPRDMLDLWQDIDGEHDLTLDAANGHRMSERIGAPTFSYSRTNEKIASRSGGPSYTLGYNSSGDVQSIQTPTGTNFITNITYGPRGDVTGLTVSPASAWQFTSDHQRNRWRKIFSFVSHIFRYGVDSKVLERKIESSGSTVSRDEYVYLAGMPVGVLHTDSTYPSPKAWWLSPDAMGTPRRVLERGDALTQISRVVENPWGKAVCGAPATCAGQQTDERGAMAVGMPKLLFRLPGQIADEESGLSENKWRMYLPDLGLYLSPDPMHRVSVRSHVGPQVYAYGAGRPLRATDPTGRFVQFIPAIMILHPTDAWGVIAHNGGDPRKTRGVSWLSWDSDIRCDGCDLKVSKVQVFAETWANTTHATTPFAEIVAHEQLHIDDMNIAGQIIADQFDLLPKECGSETDCIFYEAKAWQDAWDLWEQWSILTRTRG